MSQERLSIPETPPISADYDSFLNDIARGAIRSQEDLLNRTQRVRENGRVTDREGRILLRNRSTGEERYRSGLYGNEEYVIETRRITPEQAEVIGEVLANKLEAEKTNQQLRDTESFLNDVLNGSLKDLQDFNNRTQRVRENGRVTDREGRILLRNRSTGEERYRSGIFGNEDYVIERRSITRDQRELVGDILERKLSFTSADKGLRDMGSFIQDVVVQNLSATDLENRLSRRSENGRVTDREGQFLFRNRSTGEERYRSGIFGNEDYVIETRQVTREQAEVIRSVAISVENRAQQSADRNTDTIAASILSSNLSLDKVRATAQENKLSLEATQDLLALTTLNGLSNPEVRKALTEFLNTNNDSAIRQLVSEQRARLADVSANEIVVKDLQNTEDLVQTVRRINVRSDFWKAINDPQNKLTPNEVLATYRINDEADKQLISELRTEASKAARDNGIVELLTLLGESDRDFDAINNTLKTTSAIDTLVGKGQPSKAVAFIAESAYDLEIKSFFQELTNSLSIDKESINQAREKLQSAPIRASLSGGDFFGKFQAAKEDFIAITDQLESFAFEKETALLRQRFLNDPDVSALVNEIQSIPGASEELAALRQSLLDELALTVTVRRGQDPTRFAMLKTIQLEGIRASEATGKAELDRTKTDPERTAEAVKGLVERYQRSIMPLFESLRGTEAGKTLVEDYVSGRLGDRSLYVQRVKELEKQRELTDIERAYLESVQLLTVFNPHIVALVKEAPELTSLYLEQYFTSRSDSLRERINSTPDVYFPIVQIGLGPNGVAAAGELARNNPTAANNTLYVDKLRMPGGPFGVARGLAWELNSASSNADTTNNLPTPIKVDQEGLSVRSYGSPLVAFPGERLDGFDVRQASINVTVDYLPNPDNISTKRYPTNLDLTRITQLQTAMITENVLLSSTLVGIEQVDDGQPGNKRLLFEYTAGDGKIKNFTVRTDYVNLPGGLGEPSYGIRLEGSEAQKILEGPKVAQNGFPVLTDTIGAFEVLSDPEDKPIAPKGVIVISGSGNSTDVLAEYFGRQFESGNPALNGISKIVVVAENDLSARQRYAGLNDLKARNGQPNFVEFVKTRAGDYVQGGDGKVEIIDQKTGKPIEVEINGKFATLRADHVIAATGFKPQLDSIFGSFLAEGESIDKRAGLSRLTLPNNPGFSIANTLQNDPTVLLVGTASDADFRNSNKLAQLPDLAREALVRNGAENAVAIGFRTPDTRAAIRLQYEGLEVQTTTLPSKNDVVTVDIDKPVENVSIVPFSEKVRKIRRNVDPDTETLTALFLSALPDVRLSRAGKPLAPSAPEATRTYTFNISTSYNNGVEVLKDFGFVIDNDAPSGLRDAVAQALADPYFQAYARKALRKRRTSRGLEISLGFKRGRLVFRDPGEDAPSRTYVEAQ